MAIPFTIHVTKEIIARARHSGQDEERSIGDNCAIALALKDLFPDVFVTGDHIHPFGFDQEGEMVIGLPAIARDFIKVFDSLVAMPRVRMLIPEFNFEISIPDSFPEQINIDDIQTIDLPQITC
jgi:hypothetical protein